MIAQNYRILYFDNAAGVQRERDALPAEAAEIEARKTDAQTPQVPAAVTMLQARLALGANGMLAQANELVAAMKGDEGASARIHWEFAQHVLRTDPLVLSLAAQMGLTDAQTDQLFIDANGR